MPGRFGIQRPSSLIKLCWLGWPGEYCSIQSLFFLKFCYPNIVVKENFLNVKGNARCSWGWRSILWGRDLLKKGLKWELCDGSSIDPFAMSGFHSFLTPTVLFLLIDGLAVLKFQT